ncbi:hypothetical protein STRMA_1098 [Streptococcus macacae NCTC 11558]|uniref:Uncharacterized protein n=1 Tax=Streptococcus macacae NCTC 11558 TaxID=764298 RepID=G5JVT0_9STRE|nr:hypothetical protein STRMA_1098 [Streptococcus macacae NCTC 11558]
MFDKTPPFLDGDIENKDQKGAKKVILLNPFFAYIVKKEKIKGLKIENRLSKKNDKSENKAELLEKLDKSV